jgi:UDP-glucose 4-epimerase
MRILITGIAGFIGSHLAERMLAAGHEVMGIDNLHTGSAANMPVGVPWTFGDIVTAKPPDDGPIDLIYHLAASYRDPGVWELDARTNVLGTIKAVRMAQAHGARLVYAQTSLCYGLVPRSPVTLDAPLDPHGSYAVSKTAGEAYIRESGIDWVSLRLANIYGPRNLSGPVPVFYRRLIGDQPCTVVDSRRDFVFIDDAIDLFAAAATTGTGVFHLASGGDHSVAEVYAAVTAALGANLPEPKVVPRGPDDAASLLLDPSRTAEVFGWQPRTPLAEGVAKAVRWYASHGVRDTFTHLVQKG